MKKTLLLLAVGVAAAAGCATTERSRNLNDPRVAGPTLAAQVCSNCHGLDGNAVSPNFPRLAGQSTGYLVSQLKQFRSHNRSDPAGFVYMWGLSRHLTDDQVDALAKYFAGQVPKPNAKGDAAIAQKGRLIFESGIPAENVPPCASCHGPKGQGSDTFPRLAGQHADYLVKQLRVFQSTEQRPEGAVMKVVSHSMTPQDMQEVAAFLQGLE